MTFSTVTEIVYSETHSLLCQYHNNSYKNVKGIYNISHYVGLLGSLVVSYSILLLILGQGKH
jgi:hypothetical protein